MATDHKTYQLSEASTVATFIAPDTDELYTMSQIVIHNPNAQLETFKIYVNDVQVYEQAIPAKNSFTISGPWTIKGDVDVVTAEATADEVTFTSFGILITL